MNGLDVGFNLHLFDGSNDEFDTASYFGICVIHEMDRNLQRDRLWKDLDQVCR